MNLKNITTYFKRKPIRLIIPILSIFVLILFAILFSFLIGLILFILVNLIWLIPFIKLQKRSEMRVAKNTSKTKKTKESTQSKKKTVLLILLGIFIFFLLIFIVFLIYIAISAPKFDPENLYTKEASTLYDSNGKSFAKLGSEMREKIKYEDASEELINAIVATEDSRFFEHNGFDLPRFLKASVGQAFGNSNAGGASTITMQVAKNQFTSTTSSGLAGIKRKFTDIYLSIFQIEPSYSKEEIMEFYMNSYYLGSSAYGVEQASKTYFNKSAKELNLSEAAMIAGMFQSPVTYDPNINPDKTEERRLNVLYLMKRHGYITNEQYKIAKKMTVDKIVIKGQNANSNHAEYQGFIDTVAVEVKEATGYDPYSYSMKIYTTMDKEKQDAVNKIMSGENYSWENENVDAGIAVVETQTGAIVAIGAGRNRQGAKSFNNATMTKRQIGSTAKPLFDYGPAIEYLNWNTYHPIIDAPYTYSDGTEINNWDGNYKGTMTIRQALVDSRNIPALKTFQSVKNSDIKDFVTKLGLSPEIESGKLHEAHAIGGYNGESPLSVAAAYAAFSNEGVYNEPYSYTKIEFEESNKTIENKKIKENTEVMSKETAYMITDMLIDTGQSALGRYNNINGAQFCAKTGTSNFDEETLKAKGLPSYAVNDLWVAGYNPEYSIAVWYGYDKVSASGYNTFGSSQNSKLFQAVATNFFKADKTFTKPDGIVEVTVEQNCGEPLLPSANTPDFAKTTELFKSSAQPTQVSNRFNTLSNVTDTKSTVNGKNVTISWKAIATPDGLSRDYWSPIVGKAFAISSDQTTYLNYVMSYNEQVLGKVVYNIYLKGSNGLTHVATTSDTSTTIKMGSSSNPTYVVKASYSNFGGAESSGVDVKISYSPSQSDISIKLKGNGNIPINKGAPYSDSGVTVTEDGIDITSKCDISKTIIKDGSPVTGNWWENEGVYTINYKVIYDGKDISDKSIQRTVTVK